MPGSIPSSIAGLASLTLVDNRDRDRFELWDGDTFLGLIGYEVSDDVYTLMHTVIEEEYGQKGIARLLVTLVLSRLRLDAQQIVPVCSYVRRFLSRFPEYQVMLAPSS